MKYIFILGSISIAMNVFLIYACLEWRKHYKQLKWMRGYLERKLL